MAFRHRLQHMPLEHFLSVATMAARQLSPGHQTRFHIQTASFRWREGEIDRYHIYVAYVTAKSAFGQSIRVLQGLFLYCIQNHRFDEDPGDVEKTETIGQYRPISSSYGNSVHIGQMFKCFHISYNYR